MTTPELNVSTASDSMTPSQTKVWHERFGHIGMKGLNYLFKTGLLDKKPADLSFCENYVFGKKTNHSFKISTYVAKKPLEYVHSDLWGPA